MIAQRLPGSAPVLQAGAEALPLGDRSVDAVMVVLSDHHWRHRSAALRELRRVARDRVVLFNADPSQAGRFWLTREYLPGFLRLIPEPYRRPGRWLEELAELLGEARVETVPIPHDCRDGFYGAFWRRPAAYLEEHVRSGISVFSLLPKPEIERGMARLWEDVATGAWQERHADLLALEELDLGYRVVIADAG